MPFDDGISRLHSFSLTDFHDFDSCPFKFFVKHHLNKKYDLEEGNYFAALGSLLDQSVKLFHKTRAYGCSPEYLKNLIKGACNQMTAQIKKRSTPSFYSSIKDFLNDDLCEKAAEIFVKYYKGRDCQIRQSLGDVGFCEWVIETPEGRWKLWGGPDTLELGDDGIPEIVDYKSRENLEKGKSYMDMDLMPKIYTLLCSKKLLQMGFKKARFIVRYWQDPKDESFYEEFDLEQVKNYEEIFKQKIQRILTAQNIKFCEKSFCPACRSKERQEYIKELAKIGLQAELLEDFIVQEQQVSIIDNLSSSN